MVLGRCWQPSLTNALYSQDKAVGPPNSWSARPPTRQSRGRSRTNPPPLSHYLSSCLCHGIPPMGAHLFSLLPSPHPPPLASLPAQDSASGRRRLLSELFQLLVSSQQGDNFRFALDGT
ncbi:hypothetical protein V6N13_070445 [Hibiscus sabdariffa]|uniref:Uncharacterized protein n=1 Tax=Hibiscus sabdariffa TaxID=183260 RepID=A0ABR2TH67_9ROSI